MQINDIDMCDMYDEYIASCSLFSTRRDVEIYDTRLLILTPSSLVGKSQNVCCLLARGVVNTSISASTYQFFLFRAG